LKRYIICG